MCMRVLSNFKAGRITRAGALAFAGLFYLAAIVPSAHARTVRICTSLRMLLTNLNVESAVELEMNVDRGVMALLTTKDGKLGSLLGDQSPPAWLTEWAANKHPKIKDVRKLNWDDLEGYEQKHRLLKDVSAQRRQDFFKDRTFHGLVTRRNIQMNFSEPTSFMGKDYAAGIHDIETSGFLLPVVQYRSAWDVRNFSAVELHFRAKLPSGDLSEQAWRFQAGIGTERTHQHVHITARLPLELMRENPELYAAMLADYHRRSNLLSEILGIFSGADFDAVGLGILNEFDILSDHHLYQATQYFLERGLGRTPALDDDLKMAFVGMRGSDKYDKPGLWGQEYRMINALDDEGVVKQVLNGIQWQMNNNEFGISADQIRKWRGHLPWGDVKSRVSELSYNRHPDTLIAKAPKSVLAALTDNAKAYLNKQMITKGVQRVTRLDKNKELKMLLHDWSHDTLFFDNPPFQQKILEAQVKAVKKLDAKIPSPLNIVQEFLWESGIAQAVAESMGADLKNVRRAGFGVLPGP